MSSPRSSINLAPPLLIPLTGLISGILLSSILLNADGLLPELAGRNMALWTGSAFMLLGIVVYEIILRLPNDPVSTYRHQKWHTVWAFLIFMGGGIIAADFDRPVTLDDRLRDSAVKAVGNIRDLHYGNSGDRALVNMEAVVDSSGNIFTITPVPIMLSAPVINATVDDEITFPVSIRRIKDNPNDFESGYAEYMKRKGILYSTYIPSYQTGEEDFGIMVADHRASISGALWHFRYDLEEFLEKCPLNPDTSRFLITVLLGDRDYLCRDVRELFADAGVSHMLALSGMHVTIIAGIILFLLFPLNFAGLYRWRYFLSLPAMWFYVLITGGSASTVRAALMLTCMIVCLLLERKHSGWNGLLIATFIILLFNPSALFDVGLQLSFVCVASLVIFSTTLNPLKSYEHPKTNSIYTAILTSLLATMASWALVSYYFGIFPLLFIPANLIALPLLPYYMVVALIFFISCLTGHPISMLAQILDKGYDLLQQLLTIINSQDHSVLHLSVPGITVVLWLAGIAVIAVWLHHNHSRKVMIAGTTLCILALIAIPVMADNEENEGFILQNRPNRPTMIVQNGSDKQTLEFKTNEISCTTVNGYRVIVADCTPASDVATDSCDFLVITRSCLSEIGTLDSLYHPGTIVLHNSIHRDRENGLIHEADSLHIQVHSIRNQEPLRVMGIKIKNS